MLSAGLADYLPRLALALADFVAARLAFAVVRVVPCAVAV